MKAFFSKNRAQIKSSMTVVDQYDRNLTALSTWWGNVSLIGKISSINVASTILGDMERTLKQFHQLQQRLIDNLLLEHTRKVLNQDQSRCQMAIDVLIRNLFERTADIGFLATDQDVLNYFKNENPTQEDTEFLRMCLQSYIDIYSVYQDAILLNPQGDVVFQLSQPDRTERIEDNILTSALKNPAEYVEYFGQSKIINDDKPHLIYANAVVDDNGKVVGIIALCFRFHNELNGIFNNLSASDGKNNFLLLDGSGKTLFSQSDSDSLVTRKFNLNNEPEATKVNKVNSIKVCAKGQPYQEYSGPRDWHACSLLAMSDLENTNTQYNITEHDGHASLDDLAGLISEDLFNIRSLSKSINADLQLIVLNGIITAARKDASQFVPVLEAIRTIGTDIDTIFEQSIESLFGTIISGQLDSIRLQAGLAVDIMDRNLYERANDCRWWGLNTQLQSELSSAQANYDTIKQILYKIHSLYTVYHTLYIFDKSGRYLAFSDDGHDEKLGQMIEPNSGGKYVFALQNIYQYAVSNFEPFNCYDGAHTYIYNAAIRENNQSHNIVGGIGIVFDSTVEFNAILSDILPRENGDVVEGSKGLFTTSEGKVLASTCDEYPIDSFFTPDIDMEKLNADGDYSTIRKINDTVYLLGAAKSKGYREYKQEDGYDNTVIAWVLVPC